ncbi:putative aminotransferase class V domain, pyridoxal phosphate-dependent transferase, major [Plasmopara halstedii]
MCLYNDQQSSLFGLELRCCPKSNLPRCLLSTSVWRRHVQVQEDLHIQNKKIVNLLLIRNWCCDTLFVNFKILIPTLHPLNVRCILSSIMTKTVLCMNPGPIEFEPRVLKSFAMEGISHVDKTVIEVFGQCLEKMRKVFLAPDGQPLVVAGSGTLGWDMVGANLVNEGDDVLVVNTGYFGDNFAECLERYGATIAHLRCKIGAQPSLLELEKILQSGTSFKVVTITHVDTSTGVRAHVKEFAAAIRRFQPDAVIVVDGVCATGGEETRMKLWDLDVVLTGSQKCLGVPAGLSLMVIRPRALHLFEKNTSKVKYYVDWRNWLPIMKNYEARQPSYFATPSVNHLFALNVALDILLENGGMEQRFKEHQLVGDAIKEAMKMLGCSLVTTSDSSANTLTCVRYPTGVGAADFLPKVVKRGVSLAGGLHKVIKTDYFRIGHMGPSTRRLDHILKTVEAVEAAFIECGHKVAQPGKAAKELKKKLQTIIPMQPKCSFVYHSCPVPPKCQIYSIGMVIVAFAAGFFISQVKGKK